MLQFVGHHFHPSNNYVHKQKEHSWRSHQQRKEWRNWAMGMSAFLNHIDAVAKDMTFEWKEGREGNKVRSNMEKEGEKGKYQKLILGSRIIKVDGRHLRKPGSAVSYPECYCVAEEILARRRWLDLWAMRGFARQKIRTFPEQIVILECAVLDQQICCQKHKNQTVFFRLQIVNS